MTVRQLASIVGQIVSMNLGHGSVATWRELEAINRILQAYSKLMKGETVKWLTDDQNVVIIIKHGSRKHSLQEIAVNILSILMQAAI